MDFGYDFLKLLRASKKLKMFKSWTYFGDLFEPQNFEKFESFSLIRFGIFGCSAKKFFFLFPVCQWLHADWARIFHVFEARRITVVWLSQSEFMGLLSRARVFICLWIFCPSVAFLSDKQFLWIYKYFFWRCLVILEIGVALFFMHLKSIQKCVF